MDLINKLHTLMEKNNIKNIAQLAKATNLPYTTLKSIFDGDVNDIRLSTSKKICNFFNISLDYLLNENIDISTQDNNYSDKQSLALLGTVKAGYNRLISENIIGYVSIDKKINDIENCYALKVIGNSMEPVLYEDDIIIVHKQNSVENGQVGIVLLDNDEVTVKKIIKYENYIELVAFNSYYPPIKLTNNDNFKIIGKVIEARITRIFE